MIAFVVGVFKRGEVQEGLKILHNALEIGIIGIFRALRPAAVKAAAVEHQPEHAGFHAAGRPFVGPGGRFKDIGDFKDAQPRSALGKVVAQGLEQTGSKSRAQSILFRRQGVHDGNAVVLGQIQLIKVLVPDEAVIDGFVEAKPGGPALEAHTEGKVAFRLARAGKIAAHDRQGGLNGIQPPDAAHFLDQIGFARQVGTPARLTCRPDVAVLFKGAAHTFQHFRVELGGKLYTQKRVGAFGTEGDAGGNKGTGFGVALAGADLAAGKAGHHGRGAIHGPEGAALIDAALEAVGGFG